MEAGGRQYLERTVLWFKGVPQLSSVLFAEVLRTHTLSFGAAVAFFFLLSLVPLLMVASASLSALPIPHLWDQLIALLAEVVPPDAMVLVRSVIASVITAHPARILSIGILTYLWSTTGAFSSLIEALNIAYDVKQERPWWRDRLQALLLTFSCGALSIVLLIFLIAGPAVIQFLSRMFPVPEIVTEIWPPLRIALIISTFVTIVMILYTLGPNRKVAFKSALPGAAFSVIVWLAASAGLGFYVGHFSNYNATYGSLGAIIILMLWFYLTFVVFLVGAELNAELWKRAHGIPAGAPQSRAGSEPAARLAAQPRPTDAA